MNTSHFAILQKLLRGALLFPALVALALGGCAEEGPVQALDIYLARLARTLEQDASKPVPSPQRKPPKTSELRLELPPGNLDALDFLSLRGCALQTTIGKKNSSLGIFASDSQRLLLELEYLQLAPACIAQLQRTGEAELAATLGAAFALKRDQLPGLIFNATLANTEFRQLWKKPAEIGDYPAQTSSAVLSALAAISIQTERWLAGNYQSENREFEILLSEVAKGDAGALHYALSLQAASLAVGNQLLRGSLDSGPLCSQRYRKSAADVLPKVVEKYFIGEVQPWSAALGRRYHELYPAVKKLEKQLSAVLPVLYLEWAENRNRELSRLIRAPVEHVNMLKQVQEPCEGF
jgi:Protein of unknown function (DUF3080)